MKIPAAYGKGIREATSRPKIVLILWLANLLFASLAYVLFSSVFASALGRSGLAAGLMKKADTNFFFEALTTSGRPLGVMMAALTTLLLIYFLASIFLQGGILRGLLDGSSEKRSGRVFFAGGAAFYGRFLRLALCSVLLWLPAALILIVLNVLLKAAGKGSTNEQLGFDLRLLWIVLWVFLLFLIKMIMDYARIRIAVQDSRKVLKALFGSVRFVFRRPVLTLGLYYLLGLTGWAMFAVWRLLHSALSPTNLGAVWIGFLLAQVFIAGRGWLGIAYSSAQLQIFTMSESGNPAAAASGAEPAAQPSLAA